MNSRDKFLFVVNPIAGGLDKSEYTHTLEKVFSERGKDFEIYNTTGQGDDEETINERIDVYQPDVVVAVGGDGTCNLVASVLYEKNLVFGIIPLGSANGLATELEIDNNLNSATQNLFEGKENNLDAIIINNEFICLHLSDIGLNAKVIKRFEEEKRRGMISYARQFFREVLTAKPKKFQFEIEGSTFKSSAHMVVIANASKYGTGAIVNPIGKLNDGFFEICIVKPFPFFAFFSLAFHLFFGSLKTSPYVKIISTQNARIYNISKEVLQVDGELHEFPDVVEASIVRHAYRIIAPAG